MPLARRTPKSVASFCRICNSSCGLLLAVEDERIVGIKPDRTHPLTHGYACFKGLHAEELHNDAGRLLHPLKRVAENRFEPISIETALDEIAAGIRRLIGAHGPNSVGLYSGSGGLNAPTVIMRRAFFNAIGSSQIYSTNTIDQSAKAISFGRLGRWNGGARLIEQSDVALLVGVNPIVSHGAYQFLDANPTKRLKAAKLRVQKL